MSQLATVCGAIEFEQERRVLGAAMTHMMTMGTLDMNQVKEIITVALPLLYEEARIEEEDEEDEEGGRGAIMIAVPPGRPQELHAM